MADREERGKENIRRVRGFRRVYAIRLTIEFRVRAGIHRTRADRLDPTGNQVGMGRMADSPCIKTCPLSTKSQSFNFGTRLLVRKANTSSLPNRRRSSLVPYHTVAVASNGPQSLHRRKIPATNPPRTLPSARTRAADDIVLPFWQQNWFLLLLFLMALSLFGLAIFLYFSLQLEEGAPIPTSAVASEGVAISYGTVLKLMHERTKFRLHSHEVPYGLEAKELRLAQSLSPTKQVKSNINQEK
ncbi:uncharacterized protein LOC114580707 [Dendrobium catenatum]|uniref:uncharacterized protein LOC114580707 n=1 Tax=Dendrobium catenatum TaxID=906689 RepID=UPI00109F98D5|nr:uncharacterized protein LOC114580707 [Dendrobium catenatum]